MQPPNLLPKHDARDDSSARAPEPAAQRDGVLDMHVGLDGEGALVVAPEDVEGDAGDEVPRGVEGDVAVLALALVGHAAVEGVLGRGGGAVDGHGELEVYREGEAYDVESGADVGRGAGGADGEGFLLLCHFCVFFLPEVKLPVILGEGIS